MVPPSLRVRGLLLGAALASVFDASPLERRSADGNPCTGARWNCPCSGKYRVAKRDYHAVHEAVKHTRNQAESLIQNLGMRFGNDRHVEDLRACVDGQQRSCMETYLEPSCNLTGLPRCSGPSCELEGIPVVDKLRLRRGARHIESVRQKMDQMLRVPLAYLAVYVEQAKHDEAERGQHAVDQTIRELEDTGIYRILCHLHRDYAVNGIPWEPTVPPKHTVLSHSCRKFTSRAPSDNRNFMVFYTLNRLLHGVVDELDKDLGKVKRGWAGAQSSSRSVFHPQTRVDFDYMQ